MKCPKCGKNYSENNAICPECGTDPAKNPTAVKGLVFGIVSLCTCWIPVIGIIFAVLAIVFGGKTKKNCEMGYGQRSMATLAKVFGIIGIIANLFFIIIYVVIAVLVNNAQQMFPNDPIETALQKYSDYLQTLA